ncbi:hypothetical protein [Legionella fallonii]|uniref:Transmembrane protein n=1 Tax=Legionella fallonii LLAP-10 TaxID=1212491 RepID=A0A098G3C5_9GAMM|nr:hypothetical protein [Legionella fallonii]CEG56977.1 conserved protein of unknown function [Legionella fallonii LLAP-10]
MTKFFEHIEGLVNSKISVLKTLFSIFKLEARLAGLSVYPLLLNVCMLFVILITLWLSTMLVIGYLAMLFLQTLLQATLFIILVNLILFFILLKYLTFNLSNMSFEKTRAYLSPKESSKDDKLKTPIANRDSEIGASVTTSTKTSDKA